MDSSSGKRISSHKGLDGLPHSPGDMSEVRGIFYISMKLIWLMQLTNDLCSTHSGEWWKQIAEGLYALCCMAFCELFASKSCSASLPL